MSLPHFTEILKVYYVGINKSVKDGLKEAANLEREQASLS